MTRVHRLAAEQEVRGDIAGAQSTLLEAARRDRQYMPAWAMANFCFRNRPQQFWPWARSAARMAYGDMSPLFDICLLASGDAKEVFDRVVAGRRFAEREYLAYLTRHSRLRDAHLAARSLAGSAGLADREALLNYVDGALAGAEATGALDIWNALCGRGLVPYQPSTATTLVNGDFARPISSRGLDWIERPATGVMLFQSGENDPGLEIALSGKQPERCEILAHFLPLDSGGAYVLQFQYRVADLPRKSGLIWSAGPEQSSRSRGTRPGRRASGIFRPPNRPPAWFWHIAAHQARRVRKVSFSYDACNSRRTRACEEIGPGSEYGNARRAGSAAVQHHLPPDIHRAPLSCNPNLRTRAGRAEVRGAERQPRGRVLAFYNGRSPYHRHRS